MNLLTALNLKRTYLCLCTIPCSDDVSQGDYKETTDFDSLKVAELRAMLRQLGLPVSGKKAELVVRLKAKQIVSEKTASEKSQDPDGDHLGQGGHRDIRTFFTSKPLLPDASTEATEALGKHTQDNEVHTRNLTKEVETKKANSTQNQENYPTESKKNVPKEDSTEQKRDLENQPLSSEDKATRSNKAKRTPLAIKEVTNSVSNIQSHTAASAAKQKTRGRSASRSKGELSEGKRRRRSMRMAVNKTLLDLEKLQATL
jgi:hypothetical protein